MSRQEAKIRQGAEAFLDPGEEIVGACVIAPRGATRTAVEGPGSVVGEMGARQQRGSLAAAEEAGVRLAAPMGLALTTRRLLTLAIGTPIGLGIGGKVKDVMSAVPLGEVDSIEVKRIGLRQNVTLTVRGAAIELEANSAASVKDLAADFGRAKATA